jgi:hypothetical protein
MPYRGVSREQVTLAAPEGWALSSTPPAANSRATDFSYKTTYTTTESSLEATREVRVRETRIEDEYFEEVKAFFDTARAADMPEIRMQQKLMRSATR